ncbi:DUF4271 domain-containing protein [Marivirga sp.]|uniref:DUF4271 domain-containing protein n=1 Tax=Marivirga sp. TaxID=2018662 RepID=UPI002D80313D|nr:DUF4271 domain-containing protein [Marivirga sp.]HET8861171.1 DUF4271 domain-containing protein [Marivirga sp.]
MQRFVFLLYIFLLISCSQDNSAKENFQATSEQEIRVWHYRDTLLNSTQWSMDSVRQIKLNINYASPTYLEAKTDAEIYLFIGDTLIKKSSKGFLKYSFANNQNETAFLNLADDVQKLNYGIYSIKKSSDNDEYYRLHNENRETNWIVDNFLLILGIVASSIMAIIKINYDKRYINILSLSKIFTFRLNEGDQSRVRIMDQDNLVFAGFYTFLTSGFIYFLSLGKGMDFLGIDPNGILEYLKIFGIVALGLILKIVVVAIASNLFGNGKISAFYIKEMLNINLFFLMILFFSSILIYLFIGDIPPIWLSTAIYGLLLFYFVRLILLYFKILKLSSFTNLYLFSYFCTTEIFPFLIGLKYFMR